MKKKVALIVVAVALILVLPISLVVVGFLTPSRFAATYYGALGTMYERIKRTEEKKIVIIGTSGVAFGVDSALVEGELQAAGLNYKVVNFGLYGALGTKLMLDLSRNHINEGDIVIFTPEIHAQSLSTYFSARETWYAADSNFSLLTELDGDSLAQMVGGFPAYAADKFFYLDEGTQAAPSGVYASHVFDERGDLKSFSRPHNTMPNGVDINNPIVLDSGLFAPDFIDYVNEYCAEISNRGATMLYSFSAMNEASVVSDEAALEAFYSFITKNFNFEVISDPHTYIMEKEWFYDSNFHLNESGMTARSIHLVNDLKNHLGVTAPTQTAYPEMPKLPAQSAPTGEGDNSHAAYFTYEADGDGYKIIGVNADMVLPERVIVPFSYNGKTVTSFTASAFAGNTSIKELTVQTNITTLHNHSFDGCTNLRKLVLEQTDPTKLGVGRGLLEGADNCTIYVKKSSYSQYMGDYFWSVYGGRYESVE